MANPPKDDDKEPKKPGVNRREFMGTSSAGMAGFGRELPKHSKAEVKKIKAAMENYAELADGDAWMIADQYEKLDKWAKGGESGFAQLACSNYPHERKLLHIKHIKKEYAEVVPMVSDTTERLKAAYDELIKATGGQPFAWNFGENSGFDVRNVLDDDGVINPNALAKFQQEKLASIEQFSNFGERLLQKVEHNWGMYKPKLDRILESIRKKFPKDDENEMRLKLSRLLQSSHDVSPPTLTELGEKLTGEELNKWLDKLVPQQYSDPHHITDPLRSLFNAEVKFDTGCNIYISARNPSDQLYNALRNVITLGDKNADFPSFSETLVARLTEDEKSSAVPLEIMVPAAEYAVRLRKQDAESLVKIISGNIEIPPVEGESQQDRIHRMRLAYDVVDDNLSELKKLIAGNWVGRTPESGRRWRDTMWP